ncbi:hypothetical protein DCAR_0205589 [Daucus carota subsp. sativus]|uniref:Uncharacterized protein n=1 Tax=Daucus carota subsp. sativus TaxID=79200 RepID=A0A166CR97_DAUCS|nr:hypothetical protein DCAR_0205589 [Daucus carota subsp. sativus]
MSSDAQKIIADAVEENTRMKETIKLLEEDNKRLKDEIKLLEIHHSNNERMIDLLKRHKEEQQALGLHMIDPTKFDPPQIGKKRKLEQGEGSNVPKR